MIIIQNTILPVEVLWDYREFKRDEVPSPIIPFIHSYSTEEITNHVRINGMDPVELSIIKDRALLTDGNHRIVAAKALGYSTIPVVITVFFGGSNEVFYEHTIDRFKSISQPLAEELKKLLLHERIRKHAVHNKLESASFNAGFCDQK
jgi:hypothetical protein